MYNFEVQKLHQECNTRESFLDELSKLGVKMRDYPEHQMMLLDYDQIECVKNHPVVNECRGLLMGYDGKIIRKGFTRFYNFGENGVDTFDFGNSIAFEKADGSLMFVYWCEPTNRWEIGTRGTAFAEGPNEWHGTFRGFMLHAMGRTEEQFQHDCVGFDRRVTRLYEAVGPDNRIVTPYETNHLIALSYVSIVDGSEVPSPGAIIEKNNGWNVRPIKEYRFNTQEECMIALNELKGLEEGYVVYNTLTKERVKIKNAVYLAAHRLRGNGLTLNAICELIAMNEQDEYIAVFPEDGQKFVPAQNKLNEMEYNLICNYNMALEHMTGSDHENPQRSFALFIQGMPYTAAMFKARKDGCEVIHAFNSLPVSKRADWLKEELLKTPRYQDVLISDGKLDSRMIK